MLFIQYAVALIKTDKIQYQQLRLSITARVYNSTISQLTL